MLFAIRQGEESDHDNRRTFVRNASIAPLRLHVAGSPGADGKRQGGLAADCDAVDARAVGDGRAVARAIGRGADLRRNPLPSRQPGQRLRSQCNQRRHRRIGRRAQRIYCRKPAIRRFRQTFQAAQPARTQRLAARSLTD